MTLAGFVLSPIEHFLDDVHFVSVGDLDLDPDLGVHRHLPQSGPIRRGQAPVVLVRAAHLAHAGRVQR